MTTNIVDLQGRMKTQITDENVIEFVEKLNNVKNKGIILKQYSLLEKEERWRNKDLQEYISKKGYKVVKDDNIKYIFEKQIIKKQPSIQLNELYRQTNEQYKIIEFGQVVKPIQILEYANRKYVLLENEKQIIPIQLFEEYFELDNNKQFEIILALDTTMSMQQYRDILRNKFSEITNEILKKYDNVKLSIIQFGDYMDYPNHIKIGQLTNDIKNLNKQLQSFNTYGGDPEEFYEYVLNQINENKVNFSKSSNKIVILLFDNIYHQIGDTLDKKSIITTSIRKCKFDIKKEFIKFIENGIKLYGIQTHQYDNGHDFAKEISKVFHTPQMNFEYNPNIISELITGIILSNTNKQHFGEYKRQQTDKTLTTLLQKL